MKLLETFRNGLFAVGGRSSALSLAVVLLWAAPPIVRADDELTPQDHDALILHLNIIAADPGWPQPSVDASNAILSQLRYTPLAWERFFSEYFTDYPFTDRLFNYLQLPVFYWFDDTVHIKLQMGLDAPLMLLNVDADWDAAIAGPGSSFADDPSLKEDLLNSQNMLTMMGTHDDIGRVPGAREAIFEHFIALIERHPTVLRKRVTLNRAAQPYFGMLRMGAYMTLLAAPPALDADAKQRIAETLDLSGRFLLLWNEFTCLFLENNLSSARQRRSIVDYLRSVPPELHHTASITINDFLGNTTPYQDRRYGPRRPYGGVNIFSLPVGCCRENSFPPDVSPGLVDVYSVALAQEINHVVNALTIAGDPVLAARHQALIDAAGDDRLNYLRSMFPNGVFTQAPQEFFASIANQWFTDSDKTIELGLVRFDAGRPDPINQALFIAEVYSQSGPGTFFYNTDTGGNMTRHSVPLERDLNGHINELAFAGRRYAFELDASGNVTGYSLQESDPGDLNCDCTINAFDIEPFLVALFQPGEYGDLFPGCDINLADINGDGQIDAFDIEPFLDVLFP